MAGSPGGGHDEGAAVASTPPTAVPWAVPPPPADAPQLADPYPDALITGYGRRDRGDGRRGIDASITHAARSAAHAALCGEVLAGTVDLPWAWVRTPRCAELAPTPPVPLFPA